MLTEIFTALLEWVSHHPHWAYLAVFLVAAGESLLIVGLLLPGVVLMFGFGALVATGALDLGTTLFWAAAGAVCGDGVSFWIGRHFHQRLRVVWPFNRHAALLNRGVAYFHDHGAKSVVLARFVGPLRPIVPAVAGMLDMPPRRFFTANVLSALAWAPAYTLPGVVFGAALGLAAEVAGRLAVLLAVLISLVWFSQWFVRAMYRLLQPRAELMLARALEWGRNHPALQPLVAAVLDPEQPEARGLAAILLLIAAASVVLGALSSGWLVGLDLYIHTALQDLRTPVADRMLVLINGLGDAALVFSVLGAGCAWLAVRGHHHAALHWLAAGLSAFALTHLLKLVVETRRPLELAQDIAADSFPSAHTSLGLAVYGFLAVLIARELAPRQRWIPYVCAALVVIPVGFSRAYLGTHWMLDVLGGAGVGLVCVALFGIAYRRHPARALAWPALTMVAATTLVAVGLWRADHHFERELARHTRPDELRIVDPARWWEHDWRQLPAQRHDLRVRDRQALNVQYVGTLGALADALDAEGWRAPVAASAASALLWLSPRPTAAAMPVLPQVHDGQHDVLHRIREAPDGSALYILRVWPTRWQLQPGAAPLWVGSVTELELQQRMRLFSYVVTGHADTAPLESLRESLARNCDIALRRRTEIAADVMLLRDCRHGGGAAAPPAHNMNARSPARAGEPKS